MNDFSETLLQWYDSNRRTLPWRGETDPYRIWLSEIMLQQTRTETVISYYKRFLNAFKDVASLAQAQTDYVLKLWEGLGYYSRARNLHAAAKLVHSQMNDCFPKDSKSLQTLPGIGPYAANAIASIAYGECVPALDGNQARVLSRITAYSQPLKTPFDLKDIAQTYLSTTRPGDYNQALMDLGAGICTPRTPKCASCPVCEYCQAFSDGNPEDYPKKLPPVAKREEHWAILIVRVGSRICVHRRNEKGLLGGLYEFAAAKDIHSCEEAAEYLRAQGFQNPTFVQSLPPAKHVFTHLIWRMNGFLFSADRAGEGFQCVDSTEGLAFPSALRIYREIAENLMND